VPDLPVPDIGKPDRNLIDASQIDIPFVDDRTIDRIPSIEGKLPDLPPIDLSAPDLKDFSTPKPDQKPDQQKPDQIVPDLPPPDLPLPKKKLTDDTFADFSTLLLPILREWKLACRPGQRCFPPAVADRGGRKGNPPRYVRPQTIHRHLRKALKDAKLSIKLTWYQCTRHTFASHWVMDGGSIEKLRMILGHASVVTTERYAHLKPDAFNEKDYSMATVDLAKPDEKHLDEVKGDEKNENWAQNSTQLTG